MTPLRWFAAILGLCLMGACARKVDESPGSRGTPDSNGMATTSPVEPSKPEEALPPTRVDDVRESGSSKTDPHADPIPPETQLDLATVAITLDRTPCFGWCPDYTVVIEGSGRVRYAGRQYVKTSGDREGRIPVTAVRELVDEFRKIDFLALEDCYDVDWFDVPATYVTLRTGERSKRVRNLWFGQRFDPSGNEFPDWKIHERLYALAASIDRAVGIEQWIGTREERQRLFSEMGR
jgi:hypothetical protein